MIVARKSREVIELRKKMSGTVGFVPTMGALHEGHLSLIRKAGEENDNVIVSIFVNPTQFLPGEDLEKYPRKEDADIKICEMAGVDLLYMPGADDMYEKDELRISSPALRGYILEGARRPGHFDGVLQVVMKLLNLSCADRAYFGKKDTQQLIHVRQMVRNYFMKTEIVACETVRDRDGLALSSRNVYLSREERKRALSIPRALERAGKLIMNGEMRVSVIEKEMRLVLEKEVDLLEYIAVVDRYFVPISEVRPNDTVILMAVKVGKTRLIDNMWV